METVLTWSPPGPSLRAAQEDWSMEVPGLPTRRGQEGSQECPTLGTDSGIPENERTRIQAQEVLTEADLDHPHGTGTTFGLTHEFCSPSTSQGRNEDLSSAGEGREGVTTHENCTSLKVHCLCGEGAWTPCDSGSRWPRPDLGYGS